MHSLDFQIPSSELCWDLYDAGLLGGSETEQRAPELEAGAGVSTSGWNPSSCTWLQLEQPKDLLGPTGLSGSPSTYVRAWYSGIQSRTPTHLPP